MGLERVAFLLQDKENLYEIDEIFPVLEHAAELSGKTYGANHDDDVRMRIVADHVRSGLMLIGDGVTPGNEARGYVLRRILRRVVRSMRLLGVEDRVLPELLPVSLAKMKLSYPELETEWERISSIAYAEEDAFRQTLRAGTTIFETAAAEVKDSGASELTGAKAFQLHDTYGFPIDLTLEMAFEQGLSVDEVGFRQLMQEQRNRAKEDAKSKKGQHADATAYREVADELGSSVDFTGYNEVVSEGAVRGLITDQGSVEEVSEGESFELILDRTPFYAEGGGQLADHGVIELDNGARIEVTDVQSPDQRRDRPPGQGAQRFGDARVRQFSRSSTSSADGRSAARTPRPTWFTRRFARRSGRPRLRPAARTPRADSASTSPRPVRFRSR